MKRITVLGTLVLAGSLSMAVMAEQAQQPPAAPSADALTVEKVKDNLFVIRGGNAGGNTAVFITARASRSSTRRSLAGASRSSTR